MSRIAYPFLRIPDSSVEFEGWFVGDAGGTLGPAPEILSDWDYARDLTIRANLRVDWDSASRALDFSDVHWEAYVQLTVGTGQGNLPRHVRYVAYELLSADCSSTSIEVVIPGRSLSAQLVARFEIVLLTPSASRSKLSPDFKGAKLWADDLDVVIEDGGTSRFPVSSISFKSAFPGQAHELAPWYIEWRPEDLLSDFSSKVVLYVNSDDEQFLERFMLGDRATVQAVLGGVASQICSTVVLREGMDLDLAVFEEGSVGAVIRHWLAQAFPNETGVAGLLRMIESDPGAFNAALLAAADVGDRNQ